MSPETRKCQHGCFWGSGAISAPQLPCGYPSHNSTSLPGIPSKAPGQDLIWPAWSCVHPGANHVVAQSGGSADWLGPWDTPLLGGWQDHWGACWPALEVGALAALGEPQVRASGGHPGFGDQDALAGTCLNEWAVLSSDPSYVSASCPHPSGWRHTHPPSLSGRHRRSGGGRSLREE